MGTVHWGALQERDDNEPDYWHTLTVFYFEKNYDLSLAVRKIAVDFTPTFYNFPREFNCDYAVASVAIENVDDLGDLDFGNNPSPIIFILLAAIDEAMQSIAPEKLRFIFWQDQ